MTTLFPKNPDGTDYLGHYVRARFLITRPLLRPGGRRLFLPIVLANLWGEISSTHDHANHVPGLRSSITTDGMTGGKAVDPILAPSLQSTPKRKKRRDASAANVAWNLPGILHPPDSTSLGLASITTTVELVPPVLVHHQPVPPERDQVARGWPVQRDRGSQG